LKYLVKIKFFVEQFYGLLAQISTGLPQILILILISNKFTVLKAGLFGIFIGYVAIIYSISYWGMRNTYVLGILKIKKEHYFIVRLFFIVCAGLLTFILGLYKSIDLTLIYFIIFIKSVDSLLDIDFGFNQVIDSLKAQKRMSILNLLKLFGSIFFMSLYYFDTVLNSDKYSLIFFTFLIILYLVFLINNLKLEFKSFRINDFFQILKYSTIFMFATASCSLLTNLPRISIEKIYTGNELGIAGVCLSVSTLFAMVFNVNWQKYFSKYKKAQYRGLLISRYVKENILLFLICLIFSVSILPYFVSLIFNFSFSENYFFVIKLFSSFLVFSLGMNFLNIYKLTKYKFLETIFYCLTFVIFYLFIILNNTNYEIYVPILISGLFMILCSSLSKFYSYE
jgi:hypothetical protein